MKISTIRETLDSIRWTRQEFTGGTVEENRRTRLPAILAPHVTAVESLVIAPRFAKEIERRAWELEAAATVIARWQSSQSSAN